MNDINITPAAVLPVIKSQSFGASESSQSVSVVEKTLTSAVPATTPASKANVEQQLLSVETVKAAAVAGNSILQVANKNLQFQVDEATKQVVIKIIDSKTGEVVKQIPTVEMLDFIRAMKQQETNSGKLLKVHA